MILDHFPAGLSPRPQQAKLLLEIEAKWDSADVIVVTAPTACGKTEIGLTLSRWAASRWQDSTILVPSNVLVDQAVARYPEVVSLYKKDHYECRNSAHPLSCNCAHQIALARAKRARVKLMNYWVMLANRLHSPVQVFDEAHQIIDMLRGLQDLKLWRSQYRFPTTLATVSDLIEWMQEHLKTHEDEKLDEALRRIALVYPSSAVVYHKRPYRGRPDVMLSIEPTSVEPSARLLWPDGKVKKLVLMSATTGPQDVKELGLDKRRVVYLECESPIPAANRPFTYKPSFNLGHQYVKYALPKVALKIKELLAAHPEKGLIHMPYGLVEQIKPRLLDQPRLLFHDKKNKARVLATFKASDPSEGRVLVACGLYEGLDLPFDAARWQLITKVPWLSLADPWIKARSDEDPGWYAWSTAKKLIQAYGRIVRAADDYGESFIMDDSFGRLLREYRHMFPQFILDAIKTEKGG